MPKHEDLQVWWIPQVPGKPFTVSVANLIEARLLLDALAEYDLFQLDNNIKPDYANAGGLTVFDEKDKTAGPDGSWVDWSDDDGDGIDAYELDDLRKKSKKGLPFWSI
jgi:hypothetical protein